MAVFGTALWGQQESGTILGTVTDASGAVMPGVKVTITNNGTGVNRILTTNSAGNFEAPDLPIGGYSVRAEGPGFKTYEKTDVTLNVNATIRVDIPMQVGQAQQSVTVEANAIQVQSDTSEISDEITTNQIDNLDTNGRNPIQLATLTAGAASSLPDFNAPTALSSNNNVSFNGERPQHNIYLIDGGENYDRGSGGGMIVSPSPDALAEFQVLTSNYSAQFGDASGGTINIALKSGTSALHASAWEFNRNDDFDANNFFSNSSGTPKPELRYNAFGFNIGGPVVIPKLLHRNGAHKTFFFYNMEWRRLIQGNETQVSSDMSAANFTGNFSGMAPIHVPATTDAAAIAKFASFGLTPGEAFPNNTIPAGLIDPNAQALLKAGIFPQPNAGLQQYNFAAPVPTDLREEIVRIDHQLTDKIALMGDLVYDSSQNQYATSLWSGDTFPTVGTLLNAPSYSAVVRMTDTISPSLLNEVAYNFNGNILDIVGTGTFVKPSGYNVQQFFGNNQGNRIPVIQIGSPYSVNYDTGNWPWSNVYHANTWSDNLSWTKGKHNFMFGGMYMRMLKNQDIFGNTNGIYNFNGNATGNSFADFLLGYANTYQELDVRDAEHDRDNTFAFYALDNWRITSRLTLNLGLRWEGIPHAYDVNGRLSNFEPQLYNPADAPQFVAGSNGNQLNPTGPGFTTVSGIALSNVPFYLNGIVLAGRNGTPLGLVQNHWNNWAPRVGFAYDLTGDGKTVVRSGFGMFYERIQGNDVYNMGGNPPFSYYPQVSNVYFSNPSVNYTNGQAATAPTGPAGLTTLAYGDYKIPTSMQYSFQIQRQLSQAAFFTVGYVGDHDYHQPDVRNINPVPIDDPNRLAICGGNCGFTGPAYGANLDRLYPGYGMINETEAAGISNYNSLQVNFHMQATKGLTLQAAYTWSHELDDTSADLNAILDPFNRNLDYGNGDFDRRQMMVFSYVYQLPFFRGSQNAFLRSALGGWELSGITMFESGSPITITLNYDNTGLGGLGASARPNQISAVTYPQTVGQWFSTSSFADPAPLTFGTAARNSVYGPGRDNWNMALFKAFALPFREGSQFQFRLETYNTFNHTQFNGINTTLGNSGFGAVNSTFDPRTLQLGAKLVF